MVRIIPRETKFFDLFAEIAGNLSDGARLLHNILDNFTNLESQAEKLKAMEDRGDDLTHAVISKLNQTFIRPFEREDIHRLASSLDAVLDYVNAAGQLLVQYKVRSAPSAAVEVTGVIVRQAEELSTAISLLEKNGEVLDHCAEINRLEKQADRTARQAIARLFEEEKDAIALIKMKELYELLERASDKAEDAANVLEGVAMKNA